MCVRRLEHVPSKKTHEVAELRHGVTRRVKDGKRVKVGAWIDRQLASISIFNAVLDQETIDVSHLATTDSAGDLVISIANR